MDRGISAAGRAKARIGGLAEAPGRDSRHAVEDARSAGPLASILGVLLLVALPGETVMLLLAGLVVGAVVVVGRRRSR